jgi:hypothetical protein
VKSIGTLDSYPNASVGSQAVQGSASFRRLAGWLAVLSLPVAAANLLTIALAVHFNLNAISDPLLLLRQGMASARWWHFSMFLDGLGYYLMIVPLTLVLRLRFGKTAGPWTDLSALCLLAYSFIGAVGAVILATAVSPLITSYVNAGSSHRATLDLAATAISNAIYRGIWNILEEFVAGWGWLILGSISRRRDPVLGLLTIVLGAACLVDSLGSALNVDVISTTGLTIYLILAPTWAAWWGVRLLRAGSPGMLPTLSGL